eukprot:857788-Pyramimonas_sp.AAC.1
MTPSLSSLAPALAGFSRRVTAAVLVGNDTKHWIRQTFQSDHARVHSREDCWRPCRSLCHYPFAR